MDYGRCCQLKQVWKGVGSHLIWDFRPLRWISACVRRGWREIAPCVYYFLIGLVCLCAMLGVMDCDAKESQIYQFGSSFPLGTFVPTIVHSDQKNPPPSNGTISPFEIEVNLPGWRWSQSPDKPMQSWSSHRSVSRCWCRSPTRCHYPSSLCIPPRRWPAIDSPMSPRPSRPL